MSLDEIDRCGKRPADFSKMRRGIYGFASEGSGRIPACAAGTAPFAERAKQGSILPAQSVERKMDSPINY
jgi:hypothetical protein